MPKPSEPRMYRTVHKARAIDLPDATSQVIEYFTSRGYTNVSVVESGENGLGHYDFILSADPKVRESWTNDVARNAPQSAPTVEREKSTRGGFPTVSMETLTCQSCGTAFDRVRVRGRKPSLCPTCVRKAIAPLTDHAEPPTSEEGLPLAKTERFTCQKCWNTFDRPMVRGRKPSLCPSCARKE